MRVRMVRAEERRAVGRFGARKVRRREGMRVGPGGFAGRRIKAEDD